MAMGLDLNILTSNSTLLGSVKLLVLRFGVVYGARNAKFSMNCHFTPPDAPLPLLVFALALAFNLVYCVRKLFILFLILSSGNWIVKVSYPKSKST